MRLKTKIRRFKFRLSRLWARTTLRAVLQTAVALVVTASIASALIVYRERSPVFDVAREWAVAGWEFATGRIVMTVEAESGKTLMGSVLPGYGDASLEVEPLAGWERPLRAWVHTVTGYDFGEPRSLLEAEVGGFRRSVRRAFDIVRLPDGASGAAGSGAGTSGTGNSGVGASGGGRSGAATPGAAGPIGDGRTGAETTVGATGSGSGGVGTTGAGTTAGGTAGGGRVSVQQAGGTDTGGQRRDASVGPAPVGTREGSRELADEARIGEGISGTRPGIDDRLLELARRDWGDEPRILILHSHTSESYRRIPPDPKADSRHHVYNESDTGITRVGRALAERLQQVYGIGTIHSTRIHNWPHHWEAYVNARETVEEILAAYPSIDIVLDLHRQGIENAVWATTIGSVQAVSIEVIYTTSQQFQLATHPNWKRNEAFATLLARSMDEAHPGLLNRVTAVHDRRYNQDLHPHMLLLEVGNYLDLEEHAIAAARLLADAVAMALGEIQAGRIEAMIAPATVRLPQLPRPSPSSPRPSR